MLPESRNMCSDYRISVALVLILFGDHVLIAQGERLLISEVHTSSLSGMKREFIELWNPGPKPVLLTDYTVVIIDASTGERLVWKNPFIFNEQIISPGGIFVIGEGDTPNLDMLVVGGSTYNMIPSGNENGAGVAIYKNRTDFTTVTGDGVIDAISFGSDTTSPTFLYPDIVTSLFPLDAVVKTDSEQRCGLEVQYTPAHVIAPITPGEINSCLLKPSNIHPYYRVHGSGESSVFHFSRTVIPLPTQLLTMTAGVSRTQCALLCQQKMLCEVMEYDSDLSQCLLYSDADLSYY